MYRCVVLQHVQAMYRTSTSTQVWVALDDMTPDNGPLMVVPGSHVHAHSVSPSHDTPFAPREESVVQGAAAEAAGVAQTLLVAAGDVVVMHDGLLHRSLPNTCTRRPRRAWMPQLSREPLLGLAAHAVPLLF